jgi:hypothetical protein
MTKLDKHVGNRRAVVTELRPSPAAVIPTRGDRTGWVLLQPH